MHAPWPQSQDLLRFSSLHAFRELQFPFSGMFVRFLSWSQVVCVQ